MLPFEPAPFKKVLSAIVAPVKGCGDRMVIELECGHVVTTLPSRHKGAKRMRCLKCKVLL